VRPAYYDDSPVTSSLTTRTTQTQKSSASTPNKQEDVGSVGTAPAGRIRDNKIRANSIDYASSWKATKRKGVKLSLEEAVLEEHSLERCPTRLIGPAQKFDVVSHTPEGIREVRQAPVCLPPISESGVLQEPRNLEDHGNLGQDKAFKKAIYNNVTSLPTPN
jgi:hypothetical protein